MNRSLKSLLSKMRRETHSPEPTLVVAERFLSETEPLSGIELPLPPLPQGARQIDVIIRRSGSAESRRISWTTEGTNCKDVASLSFAPIPSSNGAAFDLAIAFDGSRFSTDALLAVFERIYDSTRSLITINGLSPREKDEQKPVVERFWCDANGIFVEGRLPRSASNIEEATLVAGDDTAPLRIIAISADACRFTGYTNWRAGTPISLVIVTNGTTKAQTLEMPRGPLPPTRWKGRNEWDETFAQAMENDLPDESGAATSFKHFVHSANTPAMTVAEIGGRVVGDASQAMRRFMPLAGRFISVDIHASEHVDVVGDAHYLDDLVGVGSLDALFSLSVMEHLAYPWLFAGAVNRSMKLGGLVFQSTPHTWPLHEMPNDFWRFSDEALKILFGPDTGFEVIDAGMVNRIWLYPEERRGAFVDMPFNHGYGNSYIYARKVRELHPKEVCWPVSDLSSGNLARNYPKTDRASRT